MLISDLDGISFFSIRAATPKAAVGLGSAAGSPPNAAQLPIAITALAPSTEVFNISRLSTPAMVEYPVSVGIEPSTINR